MREGVRSMCNHIKNHTLALHFLTSNGKATKVRATSWVILDTKVIFFRSRNGRKLVLRGTDRIRLLT